MLYRRGTPGRGSGVDGEEFRRGQKYCLQKKIIIGKVKWGLLDAGVSIESDGGAGVEWGRGR